MSSKSVTVRLAPDLFDQLEAHSTLTGSSRTEIIAAALAQYLGVASTVPLTERVACLEERVARLEQKCLC